MASSIPGFDRDWLPCWQIRLYFLRHVPVVVLQTSYASRAFLHTHLCRPGTPRWPLARANELGVAMEMASVSLSSSSLTNVDVDFGFGNPSFSMSPRRWFTRFRPHRTERQSLLWDTGKPVNVILAATLALRKLPPGHDHPRP